MKRSQLNIKRPSQSMYILITQYPIMENSYNSPGWKRGITSSLALSLFINNSYQQVSENNR